mgnify:CR=1 FL=1
MRRRGVSNDLRERGDEWPLLPVVSGLSVVVATVVDEVSNVFGSAAALFGGLFYGLFHIQKGVSWEGHLSGALAGVWVAWLMHARHA